jgi:hypothetical protein
LLRNSNWRICIGIMMGWPHRLHGSVERGGKSPGMNTFASHPGQVTIFNGLSLIALSGIQQPYSSLLESRPVGPPKPLSFVISLVAAVKAEPGRLGSKKLRNRP